MSMLREILRWVFVLLLIAAAVGKLLDMQGFYGVVASYAVLPNAVIPPLAWMLAIGELALGLWLVSGRYFIQAAALVVTLHTVYLGWISLAWARGLDLDNCGCFGVYLARPLTGWRIVEDAVLLAAALVLLLLVHRDKS